MAPGSKTNGGVALTSTNFNPTISTIPTHRQIIILNTSNQNPTSIPTITRSKPTHPSLIMVPRVDANAVSNSPSVAIIPHPADSGQQTSVIMSVKDI